MQVQSEHLELFIKPTFACHQLIDFNGGEGKRVPAECAGGCSYELGHFLQPVGLNEVWSE